MAYLIKTENSNNTIKIALHKKNPTKKTPTTKQKATKTQKNKTNKTLTFPSVYFYGVVLTLLVSLSILSVIVSVFLEKVGENRRG